MAVESNLSDASVKKAVLNRTLTHPVSLYSTVLGILGVTGAVLFGSGPALVGGGVALGVGLGTWIVNYFFRHDRLANDFVRAFYEEQKAEVAERPKRLRQQLQNQGFTDGDAQMAKLQEKFEHLQRVLAAKFEPTELAFARYLGIAEQVYLSALDNIQHEATRFESIRTIDPEYLGEKLSMLELKGAPEAEKVPLLERLSLRDTVLDSVQQGLLTNERALTTLDTTSVKVAAVKTKGKQATLDLDTAMAELKSLAERAKHYERSG
ncbi:MAG: hypothetical protein ACPGO3_06275 [Magnetospiraceae bacterium]